MMHYFQLILTVLLLAGMAKLGFDFLVLGWKMITAAIKRKQAMRQSFSFTFLFSLALFAVVFIWIDFSTASSVDIIQIVVVAVWLSFLVSIFGAVGVNEMCQKRNFRITLSVNLE